jgi:TPR repeat protein
LILTPTVGLSGFSEGYAAYAGGDYVTAMKEFHPLSEQGSAHAQWFLGQMYEHAYGVQKDYAEAAQWYQMAAERGLSSAQNDLGTFYKWGAGVKQDYQEAIKWYRLAAEDGLPSAQFNLAELYADGHGLGGGPEDLFEARVWYRKAAALGHAKAIEALKYRFNETSDQPRLLDKTIGSCVGETRSGLARSKFDAYHRDNSVNMFGTEDDRLTFRKCMAQHGFPMDSSQ